MSQLQRYVLQYTAAIKFYASKHLVETFSVILAECNAVLTGCTVHCINNASLKCHLKCKGLVSIVHPRFNNRMQNLPSFGFFSNGYRWYWVTVLLIIFLNLFFEVRLRQNYYHAASILFQCPIFFSSDWAMFCLLYSIFPTA